MLITLMCNPCIKKKCILDGYARPSKWAQIQGPPGAPEMAYFWTLRIRPQAMLSYPSKTKTTSPC